MGYKNLKFPSDTLFLVTGAAGFVGSNLCEAILNMGYKVRALDDLSTGKQKNVDMFLGNPNYEFIKGDIKDCDAVILAAAHEQFKSFTMNDFEKMFKHNGNKNVLIDIKGLLNRKKYENAGYIYWRL